MDKNKEKKRCELCENLASLRLKPKNIEQLQTNPRLSNHPKLDGRKRAHTF
jgi:hypothetical protein